MMNSRKKVIQTDRKTCPVRIVYAILDGCTELLMECTHTRAGGPVASYVLKQPSGAQPFLWLPYKHSLNFS